MPMGTVAFAAFTDSAPGVASSGVTSTPAQVVSSSNRLGVLNGQSGNLTTETSLGFNLVEIECGWDSAWTTFSGGISSSYLASRATLAATYKAAGWQVAVSAGIFNFPSWLSSEYGSNWQNIDQYGGVSGSPNFVFNPAIQAAAAEYITALVEAMAGHLTVDYYRIGLSPSGEAHYQDNLPTQPSNTSGAAGAGSFWAFDSIAQAAGGAGLPSGVGACPLIGWHPGASSYSGGSVNQALATNWWNWYMNAINLAHQWEMTAHSAAGYDGAFMFCCPGTGLAPEVLNDRLANLLGHSTFFPTESQTNIATYWPSVMASVPNPSNTVLDISSVWDGSGGSVPSGTGNWPVMSGGETGVNNYSAPTDLAQPLTGSSSVSCADPYYSSWSSTRWLAYLAGINGLVPPLGESVGDSPPDSRLNGLASQVSAIMTLAKNCGLYGIMFANDSSMNLTSGSGYTSGSPAYATPTEVATGFNAEY